MADDYKKCTYPLVGVGGIKCPCCNQYIGKKRVVLNRIARTKLKQKDQKEFKECLNDI